MAPLNVAPGITTDAYVHLQTVISAGSHATLLDHRLCLLPMSVLCALWPLPSGLLVHNVCIVVCATFFLLMMNFMRLRGCLVGEIF